MNYLQGLLAAAAEDAYDQIESTTLSLINDYVIPALMTVLAVVAAVFLIINIIRIIKSNSEEERMKAKKNLIWCGVGVVLAIAGIWVLPLLINLAKDVFVGTTIGGY